MVKQLIDISHHLEIGHLSQPVVRDVEDFQLSIFILSHLALNRVNMIHWDLDSIVHFNFFFLHSLDSIPTSLIKLKRFELRVGWHL